MHDLKPVTPLGADAPRSDRIGEVTIAEVVDTALASLAARHGRDAECSRAAGAFLGLDLPGPGRHVAAAPFGAFWTGPGQWMVEAPHASHEDLAERLKAAVGDAGSVTEQSDAWVRFDVKGPDCRALLERLCAVDVGRMTAGEATRSVIEHMGCLLVCRAAPGKYSILGARSSAGSLHHALTAAARAIA